MNFIHETELQRNTDGHSDRQTERQNNIRRTIIMNGSSKFNVIFGLFDSISHRMNELKKIIVFCGCFI